MSDIDKAKVEEALAKLAVENPNHWTADGKPKVETVKMFSGGQAVDRAYLDANYPTVSVSSPFGVKADENTQVEQKTEAVAPVSETPSVVAETVDVPAPAATVETEKAAPAAAESATTLKMTQFIGLDVCREDYLEALENALEDLEDQEDIDAYIHRIHGVQQRLVAALKAAEARSARTAGDGAKPPSQAELLAAMHASHATIGKRVTVTVEEPRFMVDKAKMKPKLR